MSKRQVPDNPIDHHPTTKRAKQIDAKPPYDELKKLLEAQDTEIETTKVLHWFRAQDLRIHDNKALHDAYETATDASVPLLCVYLNCAPEIVWHGTSPARCDFVNETLSLMQKELKKKGKVLPYIHLGVNADDVCRYPTRVS